MTEKAAASAEFYVCTIRPIEDYIGACDRWLLSDWIGFSINAPVQSYQGGIFTSAYQAQTNEYEQCQSGRYVTVEPHEDEMRVVVATRLNSQAAEHGDDGRLRSNLTISFAEENPGSSCSMLPWQYFATIEQQITLFSPGSTVNGVRNYRHLVALPGTQPDPRTGAMVVGQDNIDPSQVLPALECTIEAAARVFYTVNPIIPLPDDLDITRISGPMPGELNATIQNTMTDAMVIYHALEYTPPSGTVYSTGVQSYAWGLIDHDSGFIKLTDEQFDSNIISAIMFGNPGHGPGIRGPVEANREVSGPHRIRHIMLGIGVVNGRSFPDDSYFAPTMGEGDALSISTSIGYTPGATEGASSYTVDYYVVNLLGDSIAYQILEAKFIAPVGLFQKVNFYNPFPVPLKLVVPLRGFNNDAGAWGALDLSAYENKEITFATFFPETGSWPGYEGIVESGDTSILVGNWTSDASAINWCVFVDPEGSSLPAGDVTLDINSTEANALQLPPQRIAITYNSVGTGGLPVLSGTNPISMELAEPFTVTAVPIPSVEAPMLADDGSSPSVRYASNGVWAVVRLYYEGTIEGVTYSFTMYVTHGQQIGDVLTGDQDVAQSDIVRVTVSGDTVCLAAKGTASYPEATLSSTLKTEVESSHPTYLSSGGIIPLADSEVVFGPFISLEMIRCVPDTSTGRSDFDGTDQAAGYMRPLMGVDTYSAIPTSILKYYAGAAP